MNLIYICNHYGLSEVSKYWEKVIEINSWQTKRISKLVVDKLLVPYQIKKSEFLVFLTNRIQMIPENLQQLGFAMIY